MSISSYALLLCASFAAPAAAQSPRVVFIRGASGTGGFLGGGSDAQLSDLFDFSTSGGNNGFGELGALLTAEGYAVEQVIESTNGAAVDFDALDLSTVSVLVLGSNNQDYSPAEVAQVTDFVAAGGGLLVISDANWGSNWGAAPSSDQPFLDPYGLVMNQDTGTYVSSAAQGDHPVPIDPILSGPNLATGSRDDVLAFDGEGVSPISLLTTPPDVTVQILARAEGNIHVNDSAGSGSFRPSDSNDAALVVAYRGAGVVVGHFDRNTFFNENGAGTDLTRFDNSQFARNLFAFLSSPKSQPYGEAKINSQGTEARTVAAATTTLVTLSAYDALPHVASYFAVGSERAMTPFAGGELLIGGDLFRLSLGLTDSQGQRSDSLIVMPATIAFTQTFQFLYRDTGDASGFGLASAVETHFVP